MKLSASAKGDPGCQGGPYPGCMSSVSLHTPSRFDLQYSFCQTVLLTGIISLLPLLTPLLSSLMLTFASVSDSGCDPVIMPSMCSPHLTSSKGSYSLFLTDTENYILGRLCANNRSCPKRYSCLGLHKSSPSDSVVTLIRQ